MTNSPRVLVELKPWEVSYLLDLLHGDWNRRVLGGALAGDTGYDAHVRHWQKARASRLLRQIEGKADQQGFGSL